MSQRSYSQGAQRMRRLLHELFRGSDWKTILAAVGFLALMQWAATATYDMAREILKANTQGWVQPATAGLSVGLLLSYIWGWRRYAASAAGGKLDIRVETPAVSCKGLVVFLSLIRNRGALGDSDAVVDNLGGPSEGESLKIELVRDRLKGPWRMPVEAIAHHIETLQCLAVIYSIPDKNEDGSVAVRPSDRFREMVKRLTAYREKPLEIVPVVLGHNSDGIDFGDPYQVLDAVEAAKKILRGEKKLRPQEIVIDITSGTKISSGIAAAAAFDDQVRFQYVDCDRATAVYSVKAYDLSYVPYGD